MKIFKFIFLVVRGLCAQAWKPGSQHALGKRGVAGLLLGRMLCLEGFPRLPGEPQDEAGLPRKFET